MMRGLKMPDAFPGFCIECQQTIGKKILTRTIGSIKIERRRSSRNKHDSALFVQRHSGPAISATIVLSGISAPGISAKFTRFRYNMKDPLQFPRVDIERADVACC